MKSVSFYPDLRPTSQSALATGARPAPSPTPLTLAQARVSRHPIAVHTDVNKEVSLTISPSMLNTHCKGLTKDEETLIAHTLHALQTGQVIYTNYWSYDRTGVFEFEPPVPGAHHVVYTHDERGEICHIAVKGPQPDIGEAPTLAEIGHLPSARSASRHSSPTGPANEFERLSSDEAPDTPAPGGNKRRAGSSPPEEVDAKRQRASSTPTAEALSLRMARQRTPPVIPGQSPARGAKTTGQHVAGPVQTSTDPIQASSTTGLIPLVVEAGVIEAALEGVLNRDYKSGFRRVCKFIETTGMPLADLQLDKAAPMGLSRQSKELLYVSLVKHRALPSSSAGQPVNVESLSDQALTQEIQKLASGDRLKLPPHLLVAIPPAMLRNAVVQSQAGYQDRTYDSLTREERKNRFGQPLTAVARALAVVSKKILARYGDRAISMFHAGISTQVPNGYRPKHPLHLTFYNRHSGARVTAARTMPPRITSTMNTFFSSIERRMGPLDPSPLETPRTREALIEFAQECTPSVDEKDHYWSSMFTKLAKELGGDIATYKKTFQQPSAQEEAGPSAASATMGPASGSGVREPENP